MDGEMDVYQAIATYTAQQRIAYVHLRNVRGKVPHYYETFIDDGDVDMTEIARILRDEAFDGVLVPDHVPEMALRPDTGEHA
jgi:mannonate dehydratase